MERCWNVHGSAECAQQALDRVIGVCVAALVIHRLGSAWPASLWLGLPVWVLALIVLQALLTLTAALLASVIADDNHDDCRPCWAWLFTWHCLALAWLHQQYSGANPAVRTDYFLADRKLRCNTAVFHADRHEFQCLLSSWALPGLDTASGLAYYPMMALGTGLAALSFGTPGLPCARHQP